MRHEHGWVILSPQREDAHSLAAAGLDEILKIGSKRYRGASRECWRALETSAYVANSSEATSYASRLIEKMHADGALSCLQVIDDFDLVKEFLIHGYLDDGDELCFLTTDENDALIQTLSMELYGIDVCSPFGSMIADLGEKIADQVPGEVVNRLNRHGLFQDIESCLEFASFYRMAGDSGACERLTCLCP